MFLNYMYLKRHSMTYYHRSLGKLSVFKKKSFSRRASHRYIATFSVTLNVATFEVLKNVPYYFITIFKSIPFYIFELSTFYMDHTILQKDAVRCFEEYKVVSRNMSSSND